METRHKRLIVISLFIAMGLFLPFLTFLLAPLKFDKSSFHISDLLWYGSCFIPQSVTQLMADITNSGSRLLYASTFVITQFIISGGIGWLVSRFIYPKPKDYL